MNFEPTAFEKQFFAGLEVKEGIFPRRRKRAADRVLTARARKRLEDDDFALPGRRCPIHDLAHAKNALARVALHGTAEEEKIVRRKVHKRYPEIDMPEYREEEAA